MSEIDYEEKNLVKTKRGTLPILITCPHNGEEHPPGVNERNGTNLPYGCQFKKDADENTFHITDGVARKIFTLTNEYPYVVIFNGHRKYIDVNREKKCGCEQLEAEIYFDEYHSAISQFAQEIRTNNNCKELVLLFDIHGKDNNASDISVGTRNKSTIQPLVRLNPGWGWDYKFGLIYLFIKRGYKMHPSSPCQEDDPEFLGGYTVKEHGGWQFEIAKSKRDPGPGQDKLTNNLADIIRIFYKHNCP
jgi:hypothetical protein